jgi:hypothetical protein
VCASLQVLYVNNVWQPREHSGIAISDTPVQDSFYQGPVFPMQNRQVFPDGAFGWRITILIGFQLPLPSPQSRTTSLDRRRPREGGLHSELAQPVQQDLVADAQDFRRHSPVTASRLKSTKNRLGSDVDNSIHIPDFLR